MLHPVGQLPESTYWRRRTTIALALVLTVVLVKSVLLSGGNSDAATTPKRLAGHLAASPGASANAGPTAASPVTSTRRPTSTAGAAASRGASTTPSPKPSTAVRPKPSTAASRGSSAAATGRSTPAGPRTVASTAPATRAAPPPIPTCATRALLLFVGSDRDYYRVGTISDLELTVANVSHQTCRSELGPRVQDTVVYHGKQRIWSSNDCYPGSETDVVTLRPGELHRMVIRWSGNSSKPGCAGKRVQVGAGDYTVDGSVGALRGRGVLKLRAS